MLRRNLIANYVGQGWTALMGFVFIPVYIRYLGIESYGLIGLFAVMSAWFSLLDVGVSPTLVRALARHSAGDQDPLDIRDLLRSVEAIAFLAAALAFLAIYSASSWLATSWLTAPGISPAVVVDSLSIMGAVAALRFIEGIYRSCLIGMQRQVLYNVLSGLMATVRGVGSVAVLVVVSPSIRVFFLWQGAVSIATVCVMLWATYSSLPHASRAGHFSLPALRPVARFAGSMIGMTFLSLLLTQVDKLLLSRLLPLSEVGYYTLASVVAGGLFMLVSPITQAWFPRLSELHARADTHGLAHAFHQSAQLVSVLMGSAAAVLFVFGSTLLEVWTQDPTLAARTAPLLQLLVAGNLLNGLYWIPHQTQLAYGWTGLAMRVMASAVVIIFPAILLITPRFGAEGAAWVWMTLNAGYVLIGTHFMHRKILVTEHVAWLVHDVMRPLASSFGISGLIFYLVPAPNSLVGKFLLLGLAVIAAFSASALSIPSTRDYILRPLRSALARLLLGRR